jgi:3',5'-cyclic AMP phosphodiesterase CpdA
MMKGKVLIGHLSDLHLRNEEDLALFSRQLDRIIERGADHLAITGDLLDRWDPALLDRALEALRARGLLSAERTTILHGNHDLASSGGHPRTHGDLWRLAIRFWDPPPLLARRRRVFYDTLARSAAGVAAPAPFAKQLANGTCVTVIDTVPFPWRPLTLQRRLVTVRHAVGCIRAEQLAWLRNLPAGRPMVLLLHHYPMEVQDFGWRVDGAMRRLAREIRVPMAIPNDERAALWRAVSKAAPRLLLCGHVHRARLEWNQGIAIGLNGESGAAWAGHTVAFYELAGNSVSVKYERTAANR